MVFWIDVWVFAFLVICLALVSAFEFINWFHDTANAVAPVIYTKSLKAKKAVLIAAVMNFLWVMLGWIWVAMAIIHLLPLDAIGYQWTAFWIVVIVSLLLSAIIWNFATWYFGIPASSSHSLIWAILWVTIMMTIIPMNWDLVVQPNWQKAVEVIESLLISPFVWFILAFWVMFLSYRYIKSKYYFSTPSKKKKRSPKIWLRSMLIATSAWVSFAHWSNDGQKWVWLAVLILVILAPWIFAVNPKVDLSSVKDNIVYVEKSILSIDLTNLEETDRRTINDAYRDLQNMEKTLDAGNADNMVIREDVLAFQKSIKKLKEIESLNEKSSSVYATSVIGSKEINNNKIVSFAENEEFNSHINEISKVVDYAPWWIIALISISLWLWTMVWRKRIVVTIWEKIWKTDMNYAQATTSALITAITITLASKFHLPVSTTHILSSSVAGTMCTWPDSEWVSKSTVKNILMAWVLTLPVTILLSAGLFYVGWLLFV